MPKLIPTENNNVYDGEVMEKDYKKNEKENPKEEKDEKLSAKDIEGDYSKFEPALKQCQAEYELALKFIKPKWDAWLVRLRLYNNQKRAKDAIGDPLLFTIFQTVLASLYTDQMTVEFVGRSLGDDEQAENLNIMAQYDGEEMQKEVIDYDWTWDTCFFGNGLCLEMEWDDESMSPIPEVMDPLTFLRDPDAVSFNGDKKGRGAARFFGREIRMTKFELEQAKVYHNLDKLVEKDQTGLTEIDRNKQARREAQGYDELRQGLTGDNASYVLYEWFTHFNGKKYLFTLNHDRSCLHRVQEIRTRKWPAVNRQLFRTSHDWDGTSIPDLVEDKQRARAIIMNLAKKGVQAKLYPNYLYNNLIIKNKADISKIEFNKFIGVPGNPSNVIAPIPRDNITTDVQWMLDLMDAGAQKSTATPDIKQGAVTEKVKSATEVAQVSQGVDTRYSLAAKLFGWSEKSFWKLWYEQYYIHFDENAYEKVVRLRGPIGPEYRRIRRENIITEADPDIFIESKTISDAKRMNKMNMWMAFANQALAFDPNTNKRFMIREIGKTMGLSTEVINCALPKTYDEMEAEEENKLLEKNKMPKISAKQNHAIHIEMHLKAADSKAKLAHIEMHKIAWYYSLKMPMMQPEPQVDPETGEVIAPNESGQAPSPMEQGKTPAPRDMAQSPLQLQAPNMLQQAM